MFGRRATERWKEKKVKECIFVSGTFNSSLVELRASTHEAPGRVLLKSKPAIRTRQEVILITVQ